MTRIYFASSIEQDMVALSHAIKVMRPGRKAVTRMLCSYHYFGRTDFEDLVKRRAGSNVDLFVDSGGFSAFTKGAEIKLADYVGFLKRWEPVITTYAVLDDLKDPVKTWENQQRMEDAGLRPLPCWHVGEPLEFLERYVERYAYVAIGGMVPYLRTPTKLMPHLVRAFKVARGRTVFHGFGATSWRIASMLPWYSVDSSTWTIGPRFGLADFFNVHAGKFEQVPLGDREAWAKRAPAVRKMGMDPEPFANFARGQTITVEMRNNLLQIIALGYMEAEGWLTRRHGVISIPTREGGTHEQSGGDHQRRPRLRSIGAPSGG